MLKTEPDNIETLRFVCSLGKYENLQAFVAVSVMILFK